MPILLITKEEKEKCGVTFVQISKKKSPGANLNYEERFSILRQVTVGGAFVLVSLTMKYFRNLSLRKTGEKNYDAHPIKSVLTL